MIKEIEKETEWMLQRMKERETYSKSDAARSLRYKAKSPDRIAALVEYVRSAEKTISINRSFVSSVEFDDAREKLGLP